MGKSKLFNIVMKYLFLKSDTIPLENGCFPDDAIAAASDFLLGLASMFEGPFSIDWLQELSGLKPSIILSILEEQTQNKIVNRVRPAIYVFENRWRQEWLDRLTPDQKESLHRHIATILIRELSEDETKPLEVAKHLLHISVGIKECRWLMRAGEIYSASFQAEKAIACFHHILIQLSQQQGDQEDLFFIKAAMAYSNSYAGRADLAIYLSFLKNALQRANERNWRIYIIMLELHIAIYERLISDFNRGIERFNRAYAKASAFDDPDLKSKVVISQTCFLFWQGRFQESIKVFEKNVYDVQKMPIGFFPLLTTSMIGHCYTLIGQITQGIGMLDNLRNYCQKIGDSYTLSHTNASLAMAMLTIERQDDAISYLKQSITEAKKSNNLWVKPLATILLALTYHIKGNSHKSQTYLQRFSKLQPSARGNLMLFPYLLEICYYMDSGTIRQLPGFSLNDEIDRMLKINNFFIKGLAYRYKALQCALKSNSIAKTIHWLTLSAKWLEKAGSSIEVGKTNIVLIRLYLERGDTLKAKTIMSKTMDRLVANEFNLIPDDLRSLIDRERNDNNMLPQIMGMAEYMTDGASDDQFLQHLIACANRLTGAERGALLVIDDNKPSMEFHLRASKNITADQMQDRMFQPSMQLIHETIRTGEHRKYAIDTSAVGGRVTKGIIRSSICVPLVIKNDAIGALYHDNRLLSNVFKDSDVKLLTYFAALATVDLERKKNRRVADRLLSSGKNDAHHPRRMESILDHFKGMVGKSRTFVNLLKQIEQVIDSNLTVLITGETGVGKSLVASVIHRLSSRRNGPFITVQCSALAEELITSELFGHEKGSFTGAVSRQIGRFELADGGTLFMDEVGDLSLEIQSRLLRVLQNKEFERVGGGEDVLCSDFRLIAATNKVLEREIQAKRFRKDLYYRINVLPLQIPPLRHRKEDIPLLVDHIIAELGLKPCQGNPQSAISQDKLKALMQYDWPGNIRELENVIQRSLIAGKEDNPSLSPLTNFPGYSSGAEDFTTLEENERRHICFAMEKTRGKIQGPGGAAELLQINHSTLTSRIKRLGIHRKQFLFHQP